MLWLMILIACDASPLLSVASLLRPICWARELYFPLTMFLRSSIHAFHASRNSFSSNGNTKSL